jgi:hypothetical protein
MENEQPVKETRGRKPINKVKMSNAERQRRYLSNPVNYEKHKLRVKEYSRRKTLMK